jgi:polysaccharide export outer membrane protein
MHKMFIVLAGALVLAGCGGRQPLVSTQQLTVVPDDTTLPAPTRGDRSAGYDPGRRF